MQQVVGVEPLDVRALREREGSVASRAGPRIRLADDSDHPGSDAVCDLRRAIRGSVIDDDNLDPRPRLPQRGEKRLPDPALDVVGGDEDRYQFFHGRSGPRERGIPTSASASTAMRLNVPTAFTRDSE